MERWERARGFGLNPPLRVKELIEQHSDDPLYTEWYVASFPCLSPNKSGVRQA